MKWHILIDSIVDDCAHYSKTEGCHVVDFDKIPDLDIMELAAALMRDSKEAYCALSENDHLESDIIPAIWAVLEKPGNQEAGWNLRETIQKTIVSYYEKQMRELIQEACDARYNRDDLGNWKYREYTSMDGRSYDVTSHV